MMSTGCLTGNTATKHTRRHSRHQSFEKLITTPKVLLAQTDTWMCNGAHKHLKDFLQYDYVGAPWMSGWAMVVSASGIAKRC